MKQFTIQLDETVCRWLEHIADTTGESIEKIISNGIYNHIADLEERAKKCFSYNE